jgi:ATP-binding cassette, subfamily B, bacterial
VTANPLATFQKAMTAVPLARWGATIASIASGVLLVLVLPILYLAVDHLIWKGVVPGYASLTPSRQQAFRDEWQSSLASQERVRAHLASLRPDEAEQAATELAMWEWRWQAHIAAKFESNVGPDALAAYLAPAESPDGLSRPTGARVGILSLYARERTAFGSSLFAAVARMAPISWHGADANIQYFTLLIVAAVVVLLLHTISMLAADYWAAEASLEVGVKLRRNVYAHATRLGLLASKPQAAREAAVLFTDNVERIQDGVRAGLRGGLWAPTTIVLLFGLLFIVNPILTLAFLFTGALVWIVLGSYAANFAREGRRAARRSEARMAQMRESVNYLNLVKCYLMDRFSQTRLERQLTDYGRAEWRRLRGQALSQPLMSSITTLSAVIVLYLAGRAVLHGQLSVAGLTMKVVAVVMLVFAFRSWISARLRVRAAKIAAMPLGEFLDRRVDPGQAIDAEFLPALEKTLDLVEVSVRETGTGRLLLEHVSFSVAAGERIAVVASNESERRALVGLFSRFVEPAGGEVRIDGRNIRWVTLESLRTQVAVISQPHIIFTDTVANNISCGDAGFTTPQMIEAAKLAHAHQFVLRLPSGYETLIGDGGIALKAGEKLRIAIARAILRDPSLVIIDEPRDVLDSDSQDLLDDTYDRMGRTLVFLTAREAILRRTDCVYLLHNGAIAASGPHHELMETSELYRRLVFKELPVLV